jgi:predicted NAD/FAD-binding protein
VSSRPQWLTVKGGAKNYVEAVTRAVPAHQVHMCMPVTAVRGSGSVGEDGRETVLVSAKRGSVEFEYEYDHVIVATHGDQALRLLGDGATEREREILREFRTSTNTAVLHGDRKVCGLFCRIEKKISIPQFPVSLW